MGAPATGRTCCLRRFSEIETFSETTLTTFVDFMVRHLTLNDIRMRLLMWEVNGLDMKRAADMRSPYYHGAQGVLVVYDTTSVPI